MDIEDPAMPLSSQLKRGLGLTYEALNY